MCGINGIFSSVLAKEEMKSKIKIMNELINYRGPDNSSIHLTDFLAMGHNRLSIIDTSASGNQPFFNENHILSYNGEIYNHVYLRGKYFKNKRFKSESDTELLFQLLSNYEISKVLNLVNGMFAFGYFHKPEKTLYLCRDRLGIKPLFWVENNGEVYFSSEVKSIKAVLNSKINHLRTLHSLAMNPEETSQSLFEGINSVPARVLCKNKDESITRNNKIL